MKTLLIGLLTIGSLSAHADFVCNVKTLKNNKIVSDHIVKNPRGHMSVGHLQDIVVEKDKRKESSKISLSGTISGLRLEEFLEATIYRNEFKYTQYNRSTPLTEVIRLLPGQETTVEYENYVTTISCQVDENF